jgi:hypothetical protein
VPVLQGSVEGKVVEELVGALGGGRTSLVPALGLCVRLLAVAPGRDKQKDAVLQLLRPLIDALGPALRTPCGLACAWALLEWEQAVQGRIIQEADRRQVGGFHHKPCSSDG